MNVIRKLTDAQRTELQAQGFRPVEVWLRDWDDPVFLTEAQRQARIAAARHEEDDAMRWVEQVRGADLWDGASSLDDKST